jgi:hypothetical protein
MRRSEKNHRFSQVWIPFNKPILTLRESQDIEPLRDRQRWIAKRRKKEEPTLTNREWGTLRVQFDTGTDD